jgi:ABC-2 type transport system permease protein
LINRPLIQLTLIHFREFFREPGIIFWAVVFPILMAWGLGIAFTKKAETIKHIAYIENNNDKNIALRSYMSDAIIDSKPDEYKQLELITSVTTKNLGKTSFHFIKCDQKQAEHLLKIGKVPLFITEKEENIEYNFDPANADAKLTYLLLSSGINKAEITGLTGEIKPLLTIGTRYIDFLIPGLLAMGIMMSLMWGVSYGLIDKRNKKLIRRMVATPMRKTEFLISHFIARFFLSLIEMIILYFFAWLYFGITINGSIPALLLLVVAGNIAFSGIAIFISSRTSNTEVGNGLINAVVTPMMVLSGVFFSYHNFPDWVIPFIKALPLTMLSDGIRSIFIEGSGFRDVFVEILSLTGIGTIFFTVGLKIYKWY